VYDFIEQHHGYTVGRKTYPRTDPRLGRNVRHDSRSLAYQVKAKSLDELKSVRHTRNIPVLNQGNLGACTGYSGVGAMGSGPYWTEGSEVLHATDIEVNSTYSINLYSDATKLDPFHGEYPPTDTGSDGLSIAKVLQGRGLISGYVHATSLEAALTAIAEKPCIVGIEWRSDMFNPQPDGRIMITGSLAGGHEIVMDEIDVENKRVWFTNSWGEYWGVHGRAYLTWHDFGTLLGRYGDLVQFVEVAEPAPTPDPIPEPTPVPVPEEDLAVLNEVLDAAKVLVAALEKLVNKTP
jgi:hypothetical protein